MGYSIGKRHSASRTKVLYQFCTRQFEELEEEEKEEEDGEIGVLAISRMSL